MDRERGQKLPCTCTDGQMDRQFEQTDRKTDGVFIRKKQALTDYPTGRQTYQQAEILLGYSKWGEKKEHL